MEFSQGRRTAKGAADADISVGGSGIHRLGSSKAPIRRAVGHSYQYDDLSSPYLIKPRSPHYRAWWYFTTFCSLITGFFTPWEVAFEDNPGLSPYDDVPAFIEYFLSSVFIIDIIVHFFLPSPRKDGLMENRPAKVATRYLRTWFFIDLLGVIPFGAIIATTNVSSDFFVLKGIGLVRLLRLVRLHRIFRLFREYETNVQFSLVATTLIRNLTIVSLVGHFAGCIFYFISNFYEFGDDTWIGANLDFGAKSEVERYIYSFYYSITTMTTVGYGDFSPENTAEVIFATVYMLFNIALNSYILGTITLVVIKGDEHNGFLRSMFTKLKYFAALNRLEPKHTQVLEEYIRFNLANPDLQEGDLLKSVPYGVRRMVLKELYLPILQRVEVFKGTSSGFLLRLLEQAEVDIYMPNQNIIHAGDHVYELHIMLTGCAVLDVGTGNNSKSSQESMIVEGEPFMVENFFTLEEARCSVRSHTICRVLLLSRSCYEAACQEFPRERDLLEKSILQQGKRFENEAQSFTTGGTPVSSEHVAWWGEHESEGKVTNALNGQLAASPGPFADATNQRLAGQQSHTAGRNGVDGGSGEDI